MTQNKFQLLETTLNALVGLPCWGVIVRGGLENGAAIQLGNQIPRPTPLNAPKLSEKQQHYRPAYELNIADCTWRLDSPNAIVTSWSDEPDVQQQQLETLTTTHIRAWEITWPGLDLTLHFDNERSLRLFCDQTDPETGGDNYTLQSPHYHFTIGIRSNLQMQTQPDA